MYNVYKNNNCTHILKYHTDKATLKFIILLNII